MNYFSVTSQIRRKRHKKAELVNMLQWHVQLPPQQQQQQHSQEQQAV
jgi:hypothetical protein